MTTTTMSPKVEARFKQSAATARRVLVDNMLVESEGFTQMTVLEEASKNAGVLIVEGLVGRCGVATANKRFYGESIMRREVHRLQERIEARSLLAAVDHPVDGKSRIREAGAMCVGLRVESDGRVIGKYQVVEASDGGRNLAAFLRAGASIGMSSRGLGSTRINESGHHVVGEDFKLHGFDFVADPACRDAFPGLVSEDVDVTTVDENQLRATFGSLIEGIEDRARQAGAETADDDVRLRVEEEFNQALDEAGESLRGDIKLQLEAEIREQLREDFAARLLKTLQEQRAEITAVVRSELLSDPTVAGAKRFMESLAQQLVPFRPTPDQQVVMDDYEQRLTKLQETVEQNEAAVKAKDSVIEELVDQQRVVESKARSLGFRLFVERALIGKSNADSLREMIGDPEQFENGEALRSHVEAVIHQVEEAHMTAEQKAQNRLKLKEHKADLAREQAKLQSEEFSSLKEEMQRQLDGLNRRVNSQARERDETLAEAADHIDRLERQLVESKRAQTDADLYTYATRRTTGHPRGADIMSMIESGRITTKEQVKQLAEEWDVQASEPGGASERIRRSLGRGREAPTESEFRTAEQLTEDQRQVFGDMKTTMAEMRALSGIGHDFNSRRF